VPTSLAELALRTGATLDGDGAVEVSRVATLEFAGPGAIAFLANPKYRSQLASTGASAVIVAPEMAAQTALPKLVGGNPYAIYAKVAAILHAAPGAAAGAHPSAIVDPRAKVAASATVGPNAVIGAGAVVGERARIGAGSVVGAGASIGDDVILHAHVTIYDRCIVGPRSVLHSGAVIGADGFGLAEENGRWLKIPQIGRVVIGADVEIGANTTIDRGAIDDTVLEDDVKLDNQIQVGHNCRIGAHTAIAGCVGIAGSTRIGKNCKIGGAAMINGHIEICDDVVVSGGTGIHRSITVPGTYTSVVFGALPQAEWRHAQSLFQRLPELQRRVRRLEIGTNEAPVDAPGKGKGEQ
jgi:UDP-3-O-[3-hydroxymyristoyl] glucosamine N-acyltransferase